MLEYGTLGQLADQVGRQIEDSTTDRAIKIKEWINTHYSQIARGHRWPQLVRISEDRASLTAGQANLYLPKEVEQVYLIFPKGGFPPLLGRSLDTLIEQYWGVESTSGPCIAFAEAGEVGYMTDFYIAGETLTITHSGSGTISGVVHGMTTAAEGLVAGSELTEAVSILQATGVVTTNSWTDLIAVSCEELASGDVVTVTGTTSSNVYAKISGGERTARYKRIRLMQPPDAASDYTLVWKKRVARLVEDHQAVEIPVGDVLIDMVCSSMLSSQREYGAASQHFQRAQFELERLTSSTVADSSTVQQFIPAISLRRGRFGGAMLGY